VSEELKIYEGLIFKAQQVEKNPVRNLHIQRAFSSFEGCKKSRKMDTKLAFAKLVKVLNAAQNMQQVLVGGIGIHQAPHV
jgi:hypothetical protein